MPSSLPAILVSAFFIFKFLYSSFDCKRFWANISLAVCLLRSFKLPTSVTLFPANVALRQYLGNFTRSNVSNWCLTPSLQLRPVPAPSTMGWESEGWRHTSVIDFIIQMNRGHRVRSLSTGCVRRKQQQPLSELNASGIRQWHRHLRLRIRRTATRE